MNKMQLIHSHTLGKLDQTLLIDIQNIPSKISFKISEIAKLLNVKTYVLRYWESEFDLFRPRKMSNGQRLYFKKDVEVALLIKKLLYRDGFSVRGAKKALQVIHMEKKAYQKKSKQMDYVLKSLISIQKMVADLRELIK